METDGSLSAWDSDAGVLALVEPGLGRLDDAEFELDEPSHALYE